MQQENAVVKSGCGALSALRESILLGMGTYTAKRQKKKETFHSG
jgi:hypothetical protein